MVGYVMSLDSHDSEGRRAPIARRGGRGPRGPGGRPPVLAKRASPSLEFAPLSVQFGLLVVPVQSATIAPRLVHSGVGQWARIVR
jgi:hypothetical protein